MKKGSFLQNTVYKLLVSLHSRNKAYRNCSHSM